MQKNIKTDHVIYCVGHTFYSIAFICFMDHSGVKYLLDPYSYLFFSYHARLDVDPDSLALVFNDGNVVWIPQMVTTSRCIQERQEWYCRLKFGSMSYDGSKLDLDLATDRVDDTDYEAIHWEIIENTATKNVTYDDCCPEPYVDVTFSLRLARMRRQP